MKTRKQFFLIAFLFLLLMVASFSYLSVSAIDLLAEQTVYLPLIPKNYSPDGSGYGSVTGYVWDARTGDVIVGIEVCLEGATSCSLTAANGKYTIQNVPNGSQKFVANDPAGIYLSGEELVMVLVNTTVEQDFRMLQGLEDDQMRIVVTWDDTSYWGGSPNDLNLHMWWDEYPYGEDYQRIDVDNPGNCQDLEGPPYACYENDEWYGSGPDTIAFQVRDNVIYYFAVLNYYAANTGVPPLEGDSRTPPPRVELYDGFHQNPIREIEIDSEVVTGTGDMWYVFKLDIGVDYQLQNCLTSFSLPGDTPPNDFCVTLLDLSEDQPDWR